MTKEKIVHNEEETEAKAIPGQFALEEIEENIIINNHSPSGPSKEQIIEKAFNFHSKGNIPEAAKYYQLFINRGFIDHRLFSNYGIILKNLGKLKEAEILQRKAIELKPNFAEAYSNLGNVLKDLGKLKEAEILQRKAIELKPNFALAHYNLGIILKDLGKLKEAEFYYLKAIKLNPNYSSAYLNLGNILRDLGKLKEAEISLRRAIELKPDFAEAYSSLGSVLNDLGKSDEAEECYSKALVIIPNLYSALRNRWQFFFNKGEYENALNDADECNTKHSRAFALESLFALGKIDEIYKRIEKTSKLDNENIRIAAFSSFIAAKENKNTANNFCRNPLSFLYFSNIKFHCKDYVNFQKKIIKDLSEITTIWEPSNRSTHNGFQTSTHLNIFSNSSKNISKINSIILNELDLYFSKFKKESCSYIQKWPSTKNIVGWHVVLKKHGYQSAHIHPGGWLSGVIYLKVVPNLGNNEGAIEFSLNGENYFDANSPQFIYQPEAGDIVLFPASLHHRTIPFSTDTDRIVISFDLIPDPS